MLCAFLTFVLFAVLLTLLALSLAGMGIAVVAGGDPARMVELALRVKHRFKRPA